jgi:hypothetical protein
LHFQAVCGGHMEKAHKSRLSACKQYRIPAFSVFFIQLGKLTFYH